MMRHLLPDNLKLIYYVSVIAVGGAVQGVDVGIIATVINQTAFNTYMFPPGTKNVSSLLGAIVAISSAGMVVGAGINGLSLEKFGRRMTLMLASLFTIIGSILQAAANGVALMIAGRCIAGIAIGMLMPTSPLYISELAKPNERARFGGVFGIMIAVGFCLANWIGYGCSFAEGNVTWRLSLALQIPLALLIVVLSWSLPESPRWLVQTKQFDRFGRDMRRLYSHEDEDFVQRSKDEIQAQLTLEESLRSNKSFGHAIVELFSWKNIRRTATAIIVLQIIIFSGALAIQNYQSILYASLGFSGRLSLFMSAIYGFMGIIGQVINILFISDRWPRVRTLWVGGVVLAGIISILMALSKFYANGSNPHGARAGVAFIFIHSIAYASFYNSTVFTVAAEYFPTHLRGYGSSIAFMCESITAVWLGQVTPIALENVAYRYYLIFIIMLIVLSLFCFLFVKETNQMSLESIAGNFGDATVAEPKSAYMEEHHEEVTPVTEISEKV